MGDKSNRPQLVRGLHAEKGQPPSVPQRGKLCRELKQGDGGGRGEGSPCRGWVSSLEDQTRGRG